MHAIAVSQLTTISSSFVFELDARVRDDLQNLGWLGHSFLWWLIASSIVVAIGVILEGPEIVHELTPIVRRWLKRPPKRRHPRMCVQDVIKFAGFAGWLIVIAGVVGEGIFEGLDNRAQGMLQTFNGAVLATSQEESAYAIERAAENERDAEQLRNETEGLKAEAVTAKRDMVRAQLELARLTGPIQPVLVVNGVAKPDPMKGTKLRILLHKDTVIVFPKLPKGVSLDWTLFIKQDEVGQHQFGTVPKFMPGGETNSPFGNTLTMLSPLSTCTMDLTSDEHGTIDKTFGGASCPTTPISKEAHHRAALSRQR
ncbi:MAG TPA: hypothetical protein VHY48_10475 [Acidobacteriaceae bacterium]|jgi:hypothetical protein|nr:hypothetical protein [Acidobacteriaceae bacterium]